MAVLRRDQVRFIYISAALLFGVVLGMQFVRPQLPSRPVTGDLKATAAVENIFRGACYNCHSNETKLAWFDLIAPQYWIVLAHVKQARHHLNFSEFDRLPPAQQKGALFEAVNRIQLNAMPPRSYRLAHPESQVSPEQLATLKQYLISQVQTGASDPKQAAIADVQYQQVISSKPTQVEPSPNGIEFPHDYKNWKSISSTERFDNHSLRAVLGNDVAIHAIAHNRINPWPDGTVFAKVAWDQLVDDMGDVRPGQFLQVEFMIKDRRKYALTKGWGWARWKGTNLQPYGKDASFTSECVSCHIPMAKNDFVFTMPIKGGH